MATFRITDRVPSGCRVNSHHLYTMVAYVWTSREFALVKCTNIMYMLLNIITDDDMEIGTAGLYMQYDPVVWRDVGWGLQMLIKFERYYCSCANIGAHKTHSISLVVQLPPRPPLARVWNRWPGHSGCCDSQRQHQQQHRASRSKSPMTLSTLSDGFSCSHVTLTIKHKKKTINRRESDDPRVGL